MGKRVRVRGEPVETAIGGIEKFQCLRCAALSIFKAFLTAARRSRNAYR
jgi:hypothetical protein